MPFVYNVMPGVNFTTSATPNTEIDALFIAPGTKTLTVMSVTMGGKGAALTFLSGIVQRIKRWTTTASAGGTAITPSPRMQTGSAAKATAGQATAGVTPGTGGPILQGLITCSGSGPGNGWNWLNNPDTAIEVDGGATQSIDLFNSSGTASMVFETAVDIQE